MKGRLKAWRERLDAMALRERALVFVAALGVLVWGANQLLLAPLDQRRAALDGRVPQLTASLRELHAQAAKFALARSSDPDAANRKRLAALRAELARADGELARLTERLVPPTEMTRVIEAVLDGQRGLRLVRLHGLGAEVLETVPGGAGEGAPGPATLPRLYRHGLQVVFEGGYLDTLAYLRALEALPWRFLWEEMDLEVEDYPLARVTITVRSLSLDDAWIGV